MRRGLLLGGLAGCLAAVAGCGSHETKPRTTVPPARTQPASTVPDKQATAPLTDRDKQVSSRLVRIAHAARYAPHPGRLDLRRVAPFGWSRVFHFSSHTKPRDMRRAISRELGFTWKDAPRAPSNLGLLVFATHERVVSRVPDVAYLFMCIGWGGRTRAQARFELLRTNGSKGDASSGLPPSAPTVIATTYPYRRHPAYEVKCNQPLGVLH
jgi:hypothetical protein